ncbi:MAG TPA: hypothetical protein VGL59_23710 [Polyangia bacterium]
MLISLVGAAAMQSLAGCSSSNPGSGNDASGSGSGGSSATGGSSGGGSGGSGGAGSGGSSAGTGGSAAGSGSGGAQMGSGGATGTGGAVTADGGSGGAVGTDAGGKKYTCTLVFGVSITYDWFTNGFEMGAGIDNSRWELLGTDTPLMSFIQNWGDPAAPLWTMAKVSPCAMNAANPDRVVAVGFDSPKLTSAAAWLAAYDKLVATIKGKFSNIKTIVLDTMVRAPGDKACGTDASAAEAVVPAYVDSAVDMAVAKYPGLVQAGPKVAVPNCATFTGTGPHFTDAGKKVVAKEYSDYWANDQ